MADEEQTTTKLRACVIGGTGYLASLLIKHLLQKGYDVNTTARDPGNPQTISHLLELQNLGELKIFKADLTDEGSFDEAVSGCHIVFLVATPVHFDSEDPENDMIKPAVRGTLNVLEACTKAQTVKRVVMTSSAAAVTIINNINNTELVMDEECWTDVEYMSSEKPFSWGYPVSKVLAEKAAWKYAEKHDMDLITVIPSLIAGPSLTPNVPNSLSCAMSLLTGNESQVNVLKGMQIASGLISLTHMEDVVRAHIFVAEKQSASGRYICAAVNISLPELAKFLNKRYPQYEVVSEFGDVPAKAKVILSSDKLKKEGFSFKYGVVEIYDQSIEYFRKVGLLQG